MIVVAVRFHHIRDFLIENYEFPVKLPTKLVECQNDWVKIGDNIFADAHGIEESSKEIEVKEDERLKEIAAIKYPVYGFLGKLN